MSKLSALLDEVSRDFARFEQSGMEIEPAGVAVLQSLFSQAAMVAAALEDQATQGFSRIPPKEKG